MNTNYQSGIANWLWQGFSAIFILAFATSVLAQTPALRANGKIAFTSTRDGNPEIYVMYADGTSQVRLTNNSVVDDHATWSPEGTKLAFLSQRASGEFAIFQMNGDGTGKTEITPVNYQPPNYLGWDYWSMSWSPDGRQITFQDGRGIYIVNADGSSRRFLTSGIQPAWSPDGSKILFSNQPVFFYYWLFTIRPDGTDLQALPGAEPYVDTAATWSPSGDRIVFQGWDWANWEDLVVANADGTNRQTFAYGCYDNPGDLCGGLNFPDWSPDGSKIVFCLDGYGSNVDPEIWVKNVTGDGLTQLTNTSGNNVNPSWQPLVPAACPNPNPIDCAEFFVRQQYLDFLGREPEPAGFEDWMKVLNTCNGDLSCLYSPNGKRTIVSQGFFGSPEFNLRGGYIFRFYKSSLARLPTYAEMIAGMAFVSGTTANELEQKRAEFAANWVLRTDFLNAFPRSLTAQQFVDNISQTAGITLANRDQIISFLNANNTDAGRAVAMRAIVDSHEAVNKELNAAFVYMQYVGYLRRDPEPQGYNEWLTYLNTHPGDYNTMVWGFVDSNEYRRRFGP